MDMDNTIGKPFGASANRADPDQAAFIRAALSMSTQFADPDQTALVRAAQSGST